MGIWVRYKAALAFSCAGKCVGENNGSIIDSIILAKEVQGRSSGDQYGMKGVCARHVRRTALVGGARIGAQNAILCLCNTTLGIHLRVHGAHNVRYKSPSGARKSNIPYRSGETARNVDWVRHQSSFNVILNERAW